MAAIWAALARVRAGRHSRRKARPQAHWYGSARRRNSIGESSRPSHLSTCAGVPGLAQGSAWLVEIWPPLAKLVSIAAASWRSKTVTSCPARAKYQALVTPTTPAPKTAIFIFSIGRYARPSRDRLAAHHEPGSETPAA